MILTTKSWKKLFLFCLGLAVAAAFCMKWMESDFWSRGEKFTIVGLELFYSQKKVTEVLSGLSAHVAIILRYHLSFDFAFMAGVYPGISALCMMARAKTNKVFLQNLLFGLAAFQLAAWAADCIENYYLLKWISRPEIGSEFGFYHFVVAFKWVIALLGVLVSVPLAVKKHAKAD